MGVVRLLSLAAASVLLVKANGDEPNNTAVRVDCSSQMNEVRSLAGFSGLQKETESSGQLPIYSVNPASRTGANNGESLDKTYLSKVCKSMKEEKMAESVQTITPDGTYAYAVQDGTTADCEAAVTYWKEAFTNFEGLPPANSTDTTVYKSAQNVSFISLFNPKESPKVDCAYHQEQWDRITKAINSGSAAVPTFFAVAAAAVAALLLLLSLAAAAVLLARADGQEQENAATNKAVRVDCSSQMNAARSLAGFTGFQAAADSADPPEQLPIYSSNTEGRSGSTDPNTEYLTAVCKAMKQNTATEVDIKPDGTYAYAVQEGTDADCQAAVDHWKEAFTNFDGLPPTYDKSTDVYKSAKNVSFISLFNPQENPKVDCAYFTCPAGVKAKGVDSGTGDDKELKALLCVTTPKALTAEVAPFT
ncbi:SAG family member [Eimeria mitis]|uniref:SAG family member n=1 Tax=Eimeria mitis TaxID=44415 RepID=U6KB95_9EIME|nr:SAG family member [Eimeria mitis]CDJ35224.1 SAG family member [Eimeria mitis]